MPVTSPTCPVIWISLHSPAPPPSLYFNISTLSFIPLKPSNFHPHPLPAVMSRASSYSPGVVRSHSTSSSSSRFPPRNSSSSANTPQRTRSAATRPSPSAQDRYHHQYHHHLHHSPSSHSPSNHSRSQSQQASYDRKVVHYETTPSSSRRQSPANGHHHHNMAAVAAATTVGPVMHDEAVASAPTGYLHAPTHPPSVPVQPKRRTTVTTPSGQWALGKTIGAGSMGKVKLAKNMETGEQV